MIPVVTLQDIADFLLSKDDNHKFDNATCHNDGTGCLMTQFARDKGWEFSDSYSSFWEWDNDEETIAKVEKPEFYEKTVLESLFKGFSYSGFVNAKVLKDTLRPQFLPCH